jgi:hydrogenase maturation protease
MILGLGNPILGDDGIGCSVAELIGERLGSDHGIEVLSASVSPVRLVDEISGFKRLIIVDSVTTGQAEPGKLIEIDLPQENSFPVSVHHFSFGQLHSIGAALGLEMPSYVKIYGIEIVRPEEYRDTLSPKLIEVLPELADEIIRREISSKIELDSNTIPRGELAV